MLTQIGKSVLYEYNGEMLLVEPWGRDSLRIRATKLCEFPTEDWALLKPVWSDCAIVEQCESCATVQNGKIKATIDCSGKLLFENQKQEVLLEEYVRNRNQILLGNTEGFASALNIDAREFKPILGGDYTLAVRFESNQSEKIYGLGQYQQPHFDLKGCELELAQRNSQASVPFAVSSLGYGFLWNNPAIGRVSLAKNMTTWTAYSTKCMDYWITAGDTPADILGNYAANTGMVPMMPDWAMGFWQCKLRYQTQDELLSIAREYKNRGVPLSVIVIDYFHWPRQGEWKFDPAYWPDPLAMVDELTEMGVQLMVSIWPTVDCKSENFCNRHIWARPLILTPLIPRRAHMYGKRRKKTTINSGFGFFG